MATKEVQEKNTVNGGEAVNAFYEEKGKASKENLLSGGSETKISLTNKRNVRFISDTKYIVKGTVQEISDAAYEIYNKLGVIELV